MLMGSTLGMAICLSIVAGTAAGYVHNPDNKAMSSASIAFIYIFGCVFAFAFTSMQPIYPGEVCDNIQRAKGMGVFQLTGGAAGFLNTFVAPIALKNIGYWFYVFFVFWDLLVSVSVFILGYRFADMTPGICNYLSVFRGDEGKDVGGIAGGFRSAKSEEG
jgi:hypothetical protein